VDAVKLSTDAGKTWYEALLQNPVLDKAHTGFRYLWNWNGENTEIMSRAIDETGYIQPFYEQLLQARGGAGGYHFNPVTRWVVQKNGEVYLRPDAKGKV
jgi:sulfane dehydrogenase subunit SoxC